MCTHMYVYIHLYIYKVKLTQDKHKRKELRSINKAMAFIEGTPIDWVVLELDG